MPTQIEVFASIVTSVATGAVGKLLDTSAVLALTTRYFMWIVTPGKNQSGQPVEPTPQAVWDGQDGAMLRTKFEGIGILAAQQAPSSTISGTEIGSASQQVEDDSDCPWCR
ncbi:MAG TPA: hypothetical protein VGC93_02045 [Thermoanaerobaculia bacterium]